MTHQTKISWLLGLCCVGWFVLAPYPAWGQSANNNPLGQPVNTSGIQKKAKKPKQWWQRFSASASLITSLGTGSFAPSETYKNHYFAQSLALSLGYAIWKGLSVSAEWGLDWEYTRPDNAAGRRFFPRDVSLSIGWSNPIEAIKKHLSHGISFDIQLPSSLQAQVETRLLRLGLSLSLGYKIKSIVSFSYSFRVDKSFHRYTSPIFDQNDASLPSILLRQSTRTGLDLSEGFVPVPGSRNTSWMLSNTLGIAFHPHKTVAIGISFAIFNAFSYPMPIDSLTPTIPTVEGDIQADSVGRSDFTMGNVYVSWQPLKYLGFALGAASLQTPLTANNKGLRVPFFNFVTANDNTTTFYFRVAGSY